MKNPRFESIYKSLSTPLVRFISKRIGTNQEAVEEIFEETIVAAWRGLTTFKHKSSYFTWLCRIALNKIADYWRDQVNNRSRFIVPTLKAISSLEASDLPPLEKIALDELRDKVNKCLDLLPYEKRRLLWYRYWKDYSYDQIAKILNISQRAVEGQLYRARHEFAKVWRPEV